MLDAAELVVLEATERRVTVYDFYRNTLFDRRVPDLADAERAFERFLEGADIGEAQ